MWRPIGPQIEATISRLATQATETRVACAPAETRFLSLLVAASRALRDMWRPIGPQIEATSRLATQANETRAPCADTPLLFSTFYCLCTQAVRKKDDAQIGLGAPPLSDEETAKEALTQLDILRSEARRVAVFNMAGTPSYVATNAVYNFYGRLTTALDTS
eukprot:gene556-1968_t